MGESSNVIGILIGGAFIAVVLFFVFKDKIKSKLGLGTGKIEPGVPNKPK